MEKALKPTDDDTCDTSYCSLSADCRCALPGNVESILKWLITIMIIMGLGLALAENFTL